MTDDLPVRIARVEDAAVMAAVHGAAFTEAWDASAMHGLLTHPAAVAFLAEARRSPFDDQAAVGFVLAHFAADEAEVLSIAVVPGFRRKGIAGRLLSALIGHVRAAGARRIHLEVAAGNDPAIALYMACGFAPGGRRRGYYVRAGGGREDALTLALPLAPS